MFFTWNFVLILISITQGTNFFFIIDVIIVIYDVIVFADVVNLVRDEKGQIVQYLKSLTRI